MATATLSASSFFSTNLSPRIKSFDNLATRIAYALGYPQVNIEAHSNQVYDNISIALEFFSKYTSTEEFLIFDSSLYERGKGIKLDTLFSVTPDMAAELQFAAASGEDASSNKDVYTVGSMIIGKQNDLGQSTELNRFTVGVDEQSFFQGGVKGFNVARGWDSMLDSYRKVIDVFSFEEGSSAGINTLFTIEQTMAQQTYFSYALGQYGFDLVSWYVLKEWLETREKLLSQKHYFRFDEYNQVMFLTPEPKTNIRYYGLIGAHVERPLKSMIKELWVYQYALALTKIAIGRIRGKYAGTALFGGGSPNTDILQEGIAEKAALEEKLLAGAAPGFGDQAPPVFFVG
jgi:hypothetical protein